MNKRWGYGELVLQGSFKDVMTDETVNTQVVDFVRQKITEIVQDRAKAEILTPRGYALGTKRLCAGTGYYETYSKSN